MSYIWVWLGSVVGLWIFGMPKPEMFKIGFYQAWILAVHYGQVKYFPCLN
ncbi:hypothetical protein [Ferribacterium limneticum]|nr:hypothetical protein [Ferribacterium limneticum]UCV26769.1 hypothetical protein KI617_10650 [Ferribacterium limneticum]UCV30686.1 hypothetical protein KI608_10650 [Ferribacterium limneticum]